MQGNRALHPLEAGTTANDNSRETAYPYKLAFVRSLDSSSPEAHTAAIDAIAASLASPQVLDFDSLFKLDAVLAVKDHPLFELLQVFVNGGLSDFNEWLSSHIEVVEQRGL